MDSSLEAFVADAVERFPHGSLLVASYSFPASLKDHVGPIVYIGLSRPIDLVSLDSRVIIGQTAAGLTLAIEQLRLETRPTFSFVYLDADHSISALVRQINAALVFSGPDTVFILPGAVPPQRNMAMAKPTAGQAWWVGEVWTLIHILRQHGAIVETLPVEPVGVLLATHVTKIDLAHAERVARELQDSVGDSHWDSIFSHARSNEVGVWLSGIATRRAAEGMVQVVVDPLEPQRSKTSEISSALSWIRPNPTFFYNLSGGPIESDTLYDKVCLVHGVKVDEFHHAILPGRDVVLTKSAVHNQMNWHGKNYDTTAATLWMQHVGREATSDFDALTSLTAIGDQHFLPEAHFRRCIELSEDVFFGTPDEYPNYGMWLLYCVPGVKLFKEWKDRYPRFMAAAASGWQRQMLFDLGVKEHELIEHKLDCVYDVASVATMRQTYRSLALARSDAAAFDEFAEQALNEHPGGPERIFISRLSKTRQGGHRGLRNEEALIDTLRPLGFSVVEPEIHTLAKQASLFRNARVVVGLGGAGMFNVAFCRPGTQVIDIESGMGFVDAHCNLFASRGTDYGIIIGRSDDDHPSPYQKTWTIDAVETTRLIAKHL